MNEILRNTTLAILAGGEGSRMGKPKGLLTVSGQPILRHIVQAANWPGPTLLVTSPGRESPPGSDAFDAEVVDPMPGQGPVRGLLTALEHAMTEQVIVSAVDMPFIGHQPLCWLAEQLHDRPKAIAILIQRIEGQQSYIEPLPAGFRLSAAELLEQRLKQGKASLARLRECDNVHVILAPQNWPANIWANLNDPTDLARWEASISSG